MIMRTPDFWYEKPGMASYLLRPAAKLYAWGRGLHKKGGRPFKTDIPVICVGNLTIGGTGKTPTVRTLTNLIRTEKLAESPCILMRGYGADVDAPLTVDPDTHGFNDVGDEALMLSREVNVIVTPDRANGAKYAQDQGHDLILMDDGFQNPHLHKDFSLIVINGARGFGNEYLLPAGPLREPVHTGMKRADAALIIGADEHNLRPKLETFCPVFSGHIEAVPPDSNQTYYAFCGIGDPDKFRRTLDEQNISLTGFQIFADHHAYTQNDIDMLLRHSRTHENRLLTTEKDAMRLHTFPDIMDKLDIVPITLTLNDNPRLTGLLKERLGR